MRNPDCLIPRGDIGSNGRTVTYNIDAFYDRGSTLPLKCFLNNGASQPKIVRKPILFRKNEVFVYLGHGIHSRDAN